MLVNAVLSVACQYSDRPAARDRGGDYFFSEAQRHAENIGAADLTAVQAMAVMAVREGSAGRDHISYRLCGRAVRLALEMGLHLADTTAGEPNLRSSEIDIRKLTFWGVFNCEMICCLALGRISSIPKNAIEIDKRRFLRPRTILYPDSDMFTALNSEKLDALFWQPYEDANLPVSPSAVQPMKCLLFHSHQSTLAELINDINLNLYAPRERFTPRRLASAYNQYQQWYSELPDMFQLQNTAMPHVIVLHMYYHQCVLQ
ncbi:unnamed protein product [Aureobasidium pullulans]|nr:unnamed protein product [Aureobasidium pullulans]CAD0023971.1 unnamed protein product [Aureobasidium pullulans]